MESQPFAHFVFLAKNVRGYSAVPEVDSRNVETALPHIFPGCRFSGVASCEAPPIR